MIKINLLTERKPAKTKASTPGVAAVDSQGAGRSLVLIVILLLGVGVAGVWWWKLSSEAANWRVELDKADQELERLKDIIAKGEEYKKQKELLARKIQLITDLKKQQAVPVHIMDQLSRNLPDFLWLDSMSTQRNQISISGKATTYNAVSNFYSNLTESGLFSEVSLGRTFEVPEGVAFSLSCKYTGGGLVAAPEPAS